MFCSGRNWDLEGLSLSFSMFPKDVVSLDGKRFTSHEELRKHLISALWSAYEQKKKDIGEEEYFKVVKFLMLRIIDDNWRRYLEEVEHVKESVQLRSYGQRDPIIEFKKETYRMFDEMMASIYDTIANYILRVIKVDEKAEKEAKKEISRIKLVHEDFSLVNRALRRKMERKKGSVKGLGGIKVKR